MKLIYIAHPYGNKPENYLLAEHYLSMLTKIYPKHCFISPVLTFGSLYDEVSYMQGMDMCLTLLARCDELWLLPDKDGNTESRGTKIEVRFCEENSIPHKSVKV